MAALTIGLSRLTAFNIYTIEYGLVYIYFIYNAMEIGEQAMELFLISARVYSIRTKFVVLHTITIDKINKRVERGKVN